MRFCYNKLFKGKGLKQMSGQSNQYSKHHLSNSVHVNGIGAITANSLSYGNTIAGNSIKLSPQVSIAPGYSPTYHQSTDWLKNLNGGITLHSGNHYDKYEVIDSQEDILTLSTTAYRLRSEGNNTYMRLLDDTIFDNITPEDRDYASKMRDYYSKKIMMWKLKSNKPLSDYRNSLNSLVHNDSKIFKESQLGVAYYLPLFYEYDIKLDSVKVELTTNQNFNKLDSNNTPVTKNLNSVRLTPIKKLSRKTRRTNSYEYWFKDDDLNAGVVIKLDKNNPLEHLWDHIFSTEKVLKIKGSYSRRTLDDFEYFVVTKWEMDRG